MAPKKAPKTELTATAEAETGPNEASGQSKDANNADSGRHIDPVLGAIASLRSELAGFKTEICSTVEVKIADATTVLRGELANLRAENDTAITTLRIKMEEHGQELQELAETANSSAETIRDLETSVEKLREQVSFLTEKCVDLEGRSKRMNLTVAGLKEGSEAGPSMREFAALLLKEALDLEETPLIDRAHRALRRKPGDAEPPRHLIIKVHYCHTYEDIMKKVMGTREIFFRGRKIRIFRDLPPEVAKRRATFTAVRRMLRDKPGIRYGLLYPAKLRLTHGGTEKFFTDPEEATRYVERLLSNMDSG